jgi:ankyrin repeat protein
MLHAREVRFFISLLAFHSAVVAYEANVNSRDKAGRTPFYLAKAAGYRDIEELLRQHGGHE